MEKLEKMKEDFLICALCNRKFTNPKLLPCLHTFCGRCLSDYVKQEVAKDEDFHNGSTSGQIHTIGFKCPVCAAETRVEIADIMGSDDISGHFADNHLVSNLTEKLEVHMEEKNCESCSRLVQGQGQRVEIAEAWCQNCKIAFCDSCIKAHNVIKACRDHVVLSLKDMKSNPLQSMKNTKREIPCRRHRDKILEFYCHDCKEAICSSCAAVQHRKCEMVETCADSVRKLKPETETVLKDLESQEMSLTDWDEGHRREIEELEENRKDLIREIKTVRLNIDRHLATLEQSAMLDVDAKHSITVEDVKDRLKEVEYLKKNLSHTHMFLQNLIHFGSDSELLTVFDKVRQQADDMRAGIHRRRISKLFVRHKFSLDPNLSRLLELNSIGKILDVVDINKDAFPVNGENGLSPLSPIRRSSVKRTGTFRVDKAEPSPAMKNSNHSQSSLSTTSPSTSSDSMSSQEILSPYQRSSSVIRKQQQDQTSARLAAGSTGSLQRPKRVNSSIEYRQTPASNIATLPRGAKTPPIIRRSTHMTQAPPPERPTPQKRPITPKSEPRHKTERKRPEERTGRSEKREDRTTPKMERRNLDKPTSPKSLQLDKMPPTNAQLLCSFNGRTESDTKKCWPLDVAVLCDGTPVITDFHNKKIKAFDATGDVMCDVLLPSWPHGIADVGTKDVAVTLPEIANIVFVIVNDDSMSMKKRIKTVKQYRGICCHVSKTDNKPIIVVSCCASNNQSVDVLSIEGEIIHSFRHDNRQPGRTLFTWPYYVTSSVKGDIVVSDCETKTGLLYLESNGDVKFDCLSIGVVIQDPRGICADMNGNVYLADKSAHVIHCLTPDGKYRKCVVNGKDGLSQPIGVCVSPFGHLIVTQDNGDVKVFATD